MPFNFPSSVKIWLVRHLLSLFTRLIISVMNNCPVALFKVLKMIILSPCSRAIAVIFSHEGTSIASISISSLLITLPTKLEVAILPSA